MEVQGSAIDSTTLHEAQMKMLEILKIVDGICTKHNLHYWLAYGTLLGAVRHNAFIPWDDDLDILMMRKDFDKFMEIARAELPDNLLLQNHSIDPNYPCKKLRNRLTLNFTKIRMKNTKLLEYDENENEKYHQGIYIDIFTADHYPESAIKFYEINHIIMNWRKRRKKYPRNSLQRIIVSLASAIPYAISRLIEEIYIVYTKTFRYDDTLPYIGKDAKLPDMVLYRKEEIFPLRRDVPFEHCYFPVPADYDKVLTKDFGNYMQLPKVEDRYTHAARIDL